MQEVKISNPLQAIRLLLLDNIFIELVVSLFSRLGHCFLLILPAVALLKATQSFYKGNIVHSAGIPDLILYLLRPELQHREGKVVLSLAIVQKREIDSVLTNQVIGVVITVLDGYFRKHVELFIHDS